MRRALLSVLVSVLLACLAASGLLDRVDSFVADALYQRSRALSGDIVIIGIDERSLNGIGPFQSWSRNIMATALETLNADPARRPAVIGVDVLYAGRTDPIADARLAKAAALGNVVTAAAVQIGSAFEWKDGKGAMRHDSVLAWDEPYAALLAATAYGHVNAVPDRDGVLRHALLAALLPDGRTIPAFYQAVYRQYAAYANLPFHSPPTRNGLWYLSFSGKPGAYSDRVSITDLLAGKIPSDYYAGRIVLIGPYAQGLQDQFITAADRSRPMFGVEYQANAIDALIRGDFKQELAVLPQLFLLFAISFACALWFWDRRVAAATAAWLLLSAGWLVLCVFCFRRGAVLHPLWIPVAVAVLYIASVAANYMRAAADRRKIVNTFQRYVAPEIVSELLQGDSNALGLGGKLCNIAVLFVDIRGFTPMSEALPPQQVVEILNRSLTLTSECVLRYGGTLDKFIGDATMAIWGAPLAQPDYILKAAQAALDMIEGTALLEEELRQRFGHSVGFGIGLHCGPAVVGNIGAAIRMDYTAIGDTVNTAARLEAAAPPGKILISRAVASALANRIEATPLSGGIHLKGKSGLFEVLTLDGIKR